MLDGFVWRALLAGCGVALATAPLGCFVIWRRMAYFGDATSHAAILGVALALALSMPVGLGVLAVALGVALLMLALVRRGASADAALGVLSHGALAFGLVAVSFLGAVRIDLNALLFGDILAVGWRDVGLVWGGAALICAAIGWRWSALLTATLDADMARAAGLRPERETLLLTVLLALTVALALKVIGALLIAAMLILPAAAARPLARGPEAMVALTGMTGILSVAGGTAMSLALDSPTGPSIVSVAVVIFALTQLSAPLRRS